MTQKRYLLRAMLFLVAVAAGLTSCMPEQKIATQFTQAPHLISLQLTVPGMVYKYNHKGEVIENFDSLTRDQQDSALWASSRYIREVSDSILLEDYVNSFIAELRTRGFDVYLGRIPDSIAALRPQSYVLDLSQVQMDEYFYPLEDEDAFLDTIYYKRFNLNAVDMSVWYELSKASGGNPRKTVLYSSSTAYDTFDGRFFNDPFSGMVKYKYNIDTLKVKDVYVFAGYLGKKHAGFLYDYFLNQYIAKHLPEGMEMIDYYHYNLKRKNLMSAEDERFEVLGTK